MVTKPKSNSVITHGIEGDVITFTVAGQTLAFDMAKVDESIRQRAMVHGLIQRISDAAAMSRDPATGQPATPEAKFAAMRVLVDHYESGTSEWRVAKGESGPRSGNLLAALMKAYPAKSMVELAEWLNGKSKVEKAQLRVSPKIVAILAEMGPKGGDELLGELE